MNCLATAPRERIAGIGAGSFYSLAPALGKPAAPQFCTKREGRIGL